MATHSALRRPSIANGLQSAPLRANSFTDSTMAVTWLGEFPWQMTRKLQIVSLILENVSYTHLTLPTILRV